MSAELMARGDMPPFLIIFFVILGIGMVLFAVSQRKSFNATLERVARKMEGTFVEGGLFSEPSLEFRFEGRSARVEFWTGSKNSPAYSKVVVRLSGVSPGVLHILEDGFGQSFLKLFGAQDLEIGDPDFDRDYVLKATPSGLAARLFNPDRRLEGIRVVRRLRGFRSPTFDVDVQAVTVMVRQYLRDESDLVKLIECARDFTAFVLRKDEAAGIVLGEVRVATGGDCPVCGTAMSAGTVRCELCRTPHHAECWQYMGRCSTYACAGKRPVA